MRRPMVLEVKVKAKAMIFVLEPLSMSRTVLKDPVPGKLYFSDTSYSTVLMYCAS